MEDIKVPKFVLEDMLNTLRIAKTYSSRRKHALIGVY